MKLIDYVVKESKEILMEMLITKAEYYNIPINDYIMDNYCPMEFEILYKTHFSFPFKPRKINYNMCYYDDLRNKYQNKDYGTKCKECWERDIIK